MSRKNSEEAYRRFEDWIGVHAVAKDWDIHIRDDSPERSAIAFSVWKEWKYNYK